MSQRPKLGLVNWFKFTMKWRIYTKQIHSPVKELPCANLQMPLPESDWHHPRLSLLGPKALCSGSSSDPVGPHLVPCTSHTHTDRIPHWLNPRFPTAKSQMCSDLLSTCLAQGSVSWKGGVQPSQHCQWQLQLLPWAQQCWFFCSKGQWNQQTALNSCSHRNGLETKQSDKYLCSKAAMTTRGDGILLKNFYRVHCHLLLKPGI